MKHRSKKQRKITQKSLFLLSFKYSYRLNLEMQANKQRLVALESKMSHDMIDALKMQSCQNAEQLQYQLDEKIKQIAANHKDERLQSLSVVLTDVKSRCIFQESLLTSQRAEIMELEALSVEAKHNLQQLQHFKSKFCQANLDLDAANQEIDILQGLLLKSETEIEKLNESLQVANDKSVMLINQRDRLNLKSAKSANSQIGTALSNPSRSTTQEKVPETFKNIYGGRDAPVPIEADDDYDDDNSAPKRFPMYTFDVPKHQYNKYAHAARNAQVLAERCQKDLKFIETEYVFALINH